MSHPIAAGLAVKAKDTGRVLMLQRGFSDKTDPARGKIEFPGGMIEVKDFETPLEAARREFGEETGIVPPRDQVVNTWRAGVYQGFVIEIPRESSIKINMPKGLRKRANPDDPDGDEIETVLWVDPETLKSNPMVRQELKKDMRKTQKALSGSWTADERWASRLQALQMRKGVKVAAMPVTADEIRQRAALIALRGKVASILDRKRDTVETLASGK